MARNPRILWGFVCVALVASSCQCADRIRMWVSNPEEGSRRVPGESDTGGTSERREKEPNDARSQATLVELGEALAPVHGEIETSGDVDWYSLKGVGEETSAVSLEVSPGKEGLDPVLRAELAEAQGGDRPPAVVYDVAEAGESESIPRLRVGEDAQRIAVGANRGKGDYTLRFRRQLIGGTVETEPNDARESATLFDFPGEFQGFFDRPGDEDWYFALRGEVEPGIYSLQFTPVGAFRYEARLFTRRGASDPYLSVDVPKEGRARIPNVRIPDEVEGLWFHLRDGESYDRESGYRIRAAAHPEVEQGIVETEPNGARERAVEMRLGETVRGYLHRDGDRDYFDLVVGEPPELVEDEARAEARDVGTTSESEARDVDESDRDAEAASEEETGGADRYRHPLKRVDRKTPPAHVVQVGLKPENDGDRLALEDVGPQKRRLPASEEGAEVRICNRPVDDDAILRFAVGAEKLSGSRLGRDFTYRVAAVDILDQVDFLEIEPNDERSSADRLPVGRVRTGYVAEQGDRDVYAFGVPRPEVREEDDVDGGAEERDTSSRGVRTPTTRGVSVDLRGNQLDLEFSVTDATGAPVARVDRAGPGGNESTQLDLPPGLYYVEVTSARGHSCDPYELSVDVEGADAIRDAGR